MSGFAWPHWGIPWDGRPCRLGKLSGSAKRRVVMGRFLKSLRTFGYANALVVAIVAVATMPIAGQTAAGSSKAKTSGAKRTWIQPRTPDGQPDLQGIWSNATTTPLERPSALAGKQVLTDEETAG